MVQKKSVSKPAAKKTAKKTAIAKLAQKPVKKSVAKPASRLKPVAESKGAKKTPVKAIEVKTPRKAKPASGKAIAAVKPAAAKAAPAKKTVTKPAVAAKPSPKPIQTTKQEPMKKDRIEKKIPSNGKPAEKQPVNGEETVELSDRMAYGMYGGVVVCRDPKPFPKKTPYTEKEVKMLRDILVEERARLRDVLRSLDEMTLRRPNDEVDSTVPTHLAENASDNVNTETALLLRRDEEFALRQVESALERLDGGLFGVCLGCGSKIGIDRLKAKPEAHLCMSCQRAYSEKSSNR